MRGSKYLWGSMLTLVVISFITSGCALNFYKQSPRTKMQIKDLESKLETSEAQRKAEQERFEEVKRILEARLKEQIGSRQVSLQMKDESLVIILSDDILFDSGKADIKENAYSVLDKLAVIIKEEVPDKNIGIGGHTDNVPITHSRWRSNWELSSARANNVLHYLSGKRVSPKQLSATGYGEHRSISSNTTEKGRAKNRRVEIVILPEFAEKRQMDEALQTERDRIK